MNILVTVPVTEQQKQRLEAAAAGNPVAYFPTKHLTAEMMPELDVAFGNIPFPMLAKARRLKLLQLYTAGSNGYPAEVPAGCTLCNASGAFGGAISDHLLGLYFTLAKQMHRYRDAQTAHAWTKVDNTGLGQAAQLDGSTVLVLGLGDIGGKFARKAKALGAYTIGVRRSDLTQADGLDELHLSADLDALIPRADVIAMAMPDTDASRGMMSRERIFAMKQGAILLNVGRGNAVDLEALCDALEQSRIYAGLDVTDPEPLPPEHRLWTMRDALITPHIAGQFSSGRTIDNIVDIAAHNIAAAINGTPYQNIVDPLTGYTRRETLWKTNA